VLEELERRNYSNATVHSYVEAIRRFAEYFHRSPAEVQRECLPCDNPINTGH
jgi:hypothetical protein